MGMLDTVIAEANCPGCGRSQEWRIQYKYGYCRLHEYHLGDAICWFDPPGRQAPLSDHGENVGGLVAVPGFLESHCSACGRGEGAVLRFRDNVVVSVEITPSESGNAPEQLRLASGWMRFWSCRVAGGAKEARLELGCRGSVWTAAVADGASGFAGAVAARTAVAAMVSLGADAELNGNSWCYQFRQLDYELKANPKCGETTLVVVQVCQGELWGASVGDSGALVIQPGNLFDLTAGQNRKQFLGSGVCRPVAIDRQPLTGRLLVATDGLLKYASRATISALANTGDLRTAVDALIRAVTLPSGNLQDDVAVVLGETIG